MDNEVNLSEISYAEWLEKALQEMIKMPVKGVCLFAITENGDFYNNYHNISLADKFIMAGFIQQDAMWDSMAANGVIEPDGGEENDQ